MQLKFIYVQVKGIVVNIEYHFIAVYSLHSIKDKLVLGQQLKQMESLQQGPRLIIGNFNAVLNVEDRVHGTEVQDAETRDFRKFMVEAGMTELQTIGRSYTWSNTHTYSKIDRAIVNSN